MSNFLQTNNKMEEACKRGIRYRKLRTSQQDTTAINLGYNVSTAINKRMFCRDYKQNTAEKQNRKFIWLFAKLPKLLWKLSKAKGVSTKRKISERIIQVTCECKKLEQDAISIY